jgi:flagellar protein FlaG
MALEVLTGAVYHGNSNSMQKPETRTNEVNAQETGTVNINVSDVPVASKSSGGNPNEQGKGQKDPAASEKQIKDAISRANSKMKRTRCEFSYSEETKRVSIKVLDQDTEEVIREIPPEETLQMIEKMWEMAGILIDERR